MNGINNGRSLYIGVPIDVTYRRQNPDETIDYSDIRDPSSVQIGFTGGVGGKVSITNKLVMNID